MAINAKMLQYRGAYENFDPYKLLPGQFAVVLSGDPNTNSGKAVYMCFEAGTAKRILDSDDVFSDEQWQNAINAALAQAKESGEFDGPQGPKGDKGDNGSDATVTTENIKNALGYTPADKSEVSELADEIGNYETLTLGKHTDGLIYIFKNGLPVGNGMEITGDVTNGDVYGYVDENNTIVLTGKLADGTYSLKYEMDNGSTIDIGDMVLDNNVYYSITNNMTNCTNANSATQAVQGGSYSATISANSGCEISSLVVTMGGADITSSVVSGGTITIASVTGDIVITAVATEKVVTPSYTNLLPLSVDESGNDFVGTSANGGDGYEYGYRISHGSGNTQAQANVYHSGYMPATLNDVIRIKGIAKASTDTHNVIAFYDESKTRVNALYMLAESGGVTIDGDFYIIQPNQAIGTAFSFFRFCCGSITADTIVTVNEEIA